MVQMMAGLGCSVDWSAVASLEVAFVSAVKQNIYPITIHLAGHLTHLHVRMSHIGPGFTCLPQHVQRLQELRGKACLTAQSLLCLFCYTSRFKPTWLLVFKVK